MTIFDNDTETGKGYLGRLGNRFHDAHEAEARKARIWHLATTAGDHLERMPMVIVRYERAIHQHDKIGETYEREVITALLYETMDTCFMVIFLLDLDRLDLNAAQDGVGLTGEDASFVFEIGRLLERHAQQVIAYEERFDLHLDFSHPVDEREGLTYTNHRHWQDFSGNIQDSFYGYFMKVREAVHSRMWHRPKFWQHQSVGDHMARSERFQALLKLVRRLDAPALLAIAGASDAQSTGAEDAHPYPEPAWRKN